MAFSTPIFLFLFLPLTLLGYYLIRTELRNVFLLVMSLSFYAWGEPKFVFVMIGSILVNHLFAILIDQNLQKEESAPQDSTSETFRKRAKRLLCLMVAFNLSLFFVYKYLDFSITNINIIGSLIGKQPLPLKNIALPIGISFFTFQAMSYVFDVYYRRGKVQKNPLNTALYVSLFPQLVAGPIVRYETVAEEISLRKETISDFAQGVKRFIIGLSKKVIISNSVAIIADRAFNCDYSSALSVALAWFGAIAYTLQIYYDFSGYSDMAIGLGLMFGFHFNENFNYPYISKSVSEFWRRWHISLGSWFRDYVYIPLGGSRVKSRGRHIFNLFVVWFLTGLWHGAAWHYVMWGMFYFLLLVIEKIFDIPKRFNQKQACIYQIFTLLAVIIGWVLFRANGLKAALVYIACMFGLTGNSLLDAETTFLIQQSVVLICIAVCFSTPLMPKINDFIKKHIHSDVGLKIKESVENLLYLIAFLVAISFSTISSYNPFIYFNF